MGSENYKKINDLLFLGDAIDLPYYDFVVGVEELDPSDGVAYNNGEGDKLKKRLNSISRPAILHLSYQPAPPKEALGSLLTEFNINYVKSAYGIAVLNPDKTECQVNFMRTPVEFLREDGIVEEDPCKLLRMLQDRLTEY
jgi:hypothetical protein